MGVAQIEPSFQEKQVYEGCGGGAAEVTGSIGLEIPLPVKIGWRGIRRVDIVNSPGAIVRVRATEKNGIAFLSNSRSFIVSESCSVTNCRRVL